MRIAKRLGLVVVLACTACGGSASSGGAAPSAEPRSSTSPDPERGASASTVRDVFGELGEPLSDERLARIAHVIRSLERDPFGDHAPGVRFLIAGWLVESPDVSVTLCPFFTGARSAEESNRAVLGAFEVASRRDDPAAMTVFHYAAGMAAFMIEQPGQHPEAPAVQIAGLEAMLRVYDLAKTRGLTEPFPTLDDLAAKRDAGTLAEWYRQNVSCGSGGG